jgi:hypothetical protein
MGSRERPTSAEGVPIAGIPAPTWLCGACLCRTSKESDLRCVTCGAWRSEGHRLAFLASQSAEAEAAAAEAARLQVKACRCGCR